MPIHPWKVLYSKLVLNSPWAKVRCDKCELPNGKTIPDYYYWEGGDYVQIFALTPTNEVVMTRQYKHGVKEVVLELPAGMINSKNETPLAAAQRELSEETGYIGKNWIGLGTLNVSSAKSTTRAYAFLLKNAERIVEAHPDETEMIEVCLPKLDELRDLVARNEIRDAGSVATIFLAMQNLEQ